MCNGCEAVARRRSEGTHPINKTTRVTIEFNRRERTGSRRRSWTAAARQPGDRGAGGWWTTTRSKSPSTYPPLLFIVPNFHSLRTRRCLAIQKREENRDGHTDVGIRFVGGRVNDTDFSLQDRKESEFFISREFSRFERMLGSEDETRIVKISKRFSSRAFFFQFFLKFFQS